MRIYFDTEFIENGRTIELLSIGLVRQDGREYYAEPEGAEILQASDWVVANVLPHMNGPKKPKQQIAKEIVTFVGQDPEFWADYGAYDWVALCQLYGTMMDLPIGWPMYICERRMLAPNAELRPDIPHHALSDARALRDFVATCDLDARFRNTIMALGLADPLASEPDPFLGMMDNDCRVCGVQIPTAELREKCAAGNDPFASCDNVGRDLRR